MKKEEKKESKTTASDDDGVPQIVLDNVEQERAQSDEDIRDRENDGPDLDVHYALGGVGMVRSEEGCADLEVRLVEAEALGEDLAVAGLREGRGEAQVVSESWLA